ncbi:efflux RND transporter permease subunit [Bradyrhizobium sp. LHD-71]|uniref:efflux RND transporter permease subunit n=1 Tax=Bradyrhizobium sp. LHD-71 TaxID=3072141 RepID=UPI00280F421B|nr:efflux RND transporter permease subunit [Bradyrhizobium sp. LHD-71]MDQ8730107.1 efflux RND transporter permease subunit [Bradyrhizobium sp. LHD-71]
MRSFSEPFILRPVGTILLAIGLFLTGIVAYLSLPVASVPNIDFPVIRVFASRPGADPKVMAATVAAPLERRLGEISGVEQMTSTSTLGNTSIMLQFSLGRDIDRAARDVQAAINASIADLPSDLPSLPRFRKANPAASPILVVALTSKTLPPSALYDVADTVLIQRISQIPGVGEVTVSGAEQPAVRVRLNPGALASAGISTETVRSAIVNANSLSPVGAFEGGRQSETLSTNRQMRTAQEFRDIVIKNSNGNVVRLSDIAEVDDGVRNSRSAAWFNKEPSVLLTITKQNDANVIDTVDRVNALLPEMKQWIPAGVDFTIFSDRTGTIRANVLDMQFTLFAAAMLVMMVVFIFVRRLTPTIAAGISVPLALAGTFAGMWLAGFSINNLSLMALVISVGFVVDDAIVMIENMYRNLEEGMPPFEAAREGARQIGFTVLAISLSLIAAFAPLMLMEGVVGRLLREFSVTLAFAIIVSTVVSLTVTPMICAHHIRQGLSDHATWFDRVVEGALGPTVDAYGRSLRAVLRFPMLTMLVFAATIAATVTLYVKVQKGYFPSDDSGLIIGGTRASPDVSFSSMLALQQRVADIVLSDPAVAALGSSIGSSGAWGVGQNRGQMFISLKPLAERDGHVSTQQVIDRLRRKLFPVPGMRLFMFAAQDVRTGGRQSDSDYQFSLISPDLELLEKWGPIVQKRLESVEGITDVSSTRETGGLQLSLKIDRQAASSLGVRMQDIDNALYNAFAQRQISTIYTQRNQYRVVIEVDPELQRDPSNLARIYVNGADGAQVPLSAVVRYERDLSPLAVYHQGQFPTVTISFATEEGVALQTATQSIQQAVAELHMPEGIRAGFEGSARDFGSASARQPLLILGALVAVYIVLGILYESLLHPLTIISTLPSAGLGALLALQLTNTPLTVIAFIGIILLIGIVKKNGIMIVDFALERERKHGLDPASAIFEASIVRFRPILMTTLAALLAAVPLVVAIGPGTELRRPLGITIIGGLIVSQILTLYTTPVIYLLMDRLKRRREGIAIGRPVPAE